MKLIKLGVLSLALAASTATYAGEVVIQAGAREFLPLVVQAQPGDTILWKGMAAGHNTKSFDGMIPEGAQPWESKLNEDYHMTVEKEGAYAYVCVPHASFGMVGVIVVGNGKPANLGQLKNVAEQKKGMEARSYKKLVAWLKENGVE